jgi:hypothetical protein
MPVLLAPDTGDATPPARLDPASWEAHVTIDTSLVPVPWGAITATVLATLVVGALGTGAVAALGSRQALREAE